MLKTLKKIVAFLEKKQGEKTVKSITSNTIANKEFIEAMGRGEIEPIPSIKFVGVDGNNYDFHSFANLGQDISYIRLEQSRAYEFEHSEFGLNKELLNERLTRIIYAVDVLRLDGYDEYNFRQAATEIYNIASLCTQSLAFGSPIDKLLDVMSCLYIDSTENPYSYNRDYNLKKIKLWHDNWDSISHFFLQNPFLRLFDFAPPSQSDFQNALISKIPIEGEILEQLILQRMLLLGDLSEKTTNSMKEMLFRHTTMLSRIELNKQLRYDTTNSKE